MMGINQIEFIIYVADQEKSTVFYSQLLQLKPTLNVPGMTAFEISHGVRLGLMPNNGIAKIIGHSLPHPTEGTGIPRCELYLHVVNPESYLERGIQLGGKRVSSFQIRDWGDSVGYISDLDGHVIAFAEVLHYN